jgi:hypothetical protein
MSNHFKSFLVFGRSRCVNWQDFLRDIQIHYNNNNNVYFTLLKANDTAQLNQPKLIQWEPLNGITDNGINRLMGSILPY